MNITMNNTTEKTGELVSDGFKNLGMESFQWFTCVDCGTTYPYMDDAQASKYRKWFGAGIYCNGKTISKCPYCGPVDPIVRTQVVTPDIWKKPVRVLVTQPLPVKNKGPGLLRRTLRRLCLWALDRI